MRSVLKTIKLMFTEGSRKTGKVINSSPTFIFPARILNGWKIKLLEAAAVPGICVSGLTVDGPLKMAQTAANPTAVSNEAPPGGRQMATTRKTNPMERAEKTAAAPLETAARQARYGKPRLIAEIFCFLRLNSPSSKCGFQKPLETARHAAIMKNKGLWTNAKHATTNSGRKFS